MNVVFGNAFQSQFKYKQNHPPLKEPKNIPPNPVISKKSTLKKAGFLIMTLGFFLGMGNAVRANIKHNGKFDFYPPSYAEQRDVKLSLIPGIVVMGLGRILCSIGSNKKNKQC